MFNHLQETDTDTLFTKRFPIAITIMVFVIATMVLRGIASTLLGASSLGVSESLARYHASAVVYAVTIVILVAIGRNKGKENRIMSFVFGIITLGLSAALIIDRARLIGPNVEGIMYAISAIPSVIIYIPVLILYISMLAFYILVIVFSIAGILNSVAIIKANVPSGQATGTARSPPAAPAASNATAQPAAHSTMASFCSACGASLDAGALFCNKCGAKV